MLDLGSAPPSNAYLTEDLLRSPEQWIPLRVLVCDHCWLVQTEDYARAQDLFNDQYAYFSGFSKSWLEHSERYVEEMVSRLGLDGEALVVEVAANDGYLLQYVAERGVPCLGIEPTASAAAEARQKGIPIVEDFFGVDLAHRLAADGRYADLMVANNVLAHVPRINDFVAGFPIVLKPQGVATFEFPHLLSLVKENQFDTVYHEHFSYLSLTAVSSIFDAHGLFVFDVEEHPTHGGSLRVFAQRSGTGGQRRSDAVGEMLSRESRAGISTPEFYAGLQARAEDVKNEFVGFLIEARRRGKSVAAYGAAAKGNTLLNFAGVRPDLISFVVDRNPAKQGKFLPGSRIPIVPEERLREERPDYVVILPWNLRREIARQLAYVADWGGEFAVAIPRLDVFAP